MTIWVDGDGCPKRIREIACKAGIQRGVSVRIAADRKVDIPRHELVSLELVEIQEGSSDAYIASRVIPGDLVITRDVRLMEEVIRKGAWCIDDSGKTYTSGNIRERLSLLQFMEGVREAEPHGTGRRKKRHGGSSSAFARALEQVLK